MGGNIFAHLLLTPRMPPAIYFHVRTRCHALLSRFYTHLCTPLEAPEKTSYGDLDILAFGPLSPSPKPSDIAEALGAVHTITSGDALSFAIPWPSVDEVPESPDEEPGRSPAQRCIQVDLTICPDQRTSNFLSFTHAHSGLFTLLGSSLRRAGLVMTSTSLSLRIPEIEAVRRKNSAVFLTSDTSAILDFLGLDRQMYWRRFGSVEEMFRYTASCRFFTARRREMVEGEEEEDEQKVTHRTRHNSKRPLLRMWREEFVAGARERGEFDRDIPSREDVREEAFVLWPEARSGYDEKLREFRVARAEEEVVRVIAEEVPVEASTQGLRGAATKGLRRILLNGDTTYGVAPQKPLRTAEGWDVEGVREFVRSRWEEVGRRAAARGHAKMVATMEAKRAARKVAGRDGIVEAGRSGPETREKEPDEEGRETSRMEEVACT
jgi:hypothetical protein